MKNIKQTDKEIFDIINSELSRQRNTLELIASENFASYSVIETTGSILTNKYAEGYPGKRYYGGCESVDMAEDLARDRLKVTKQQFGGRQATEAFASDLPRDLNIQSGTAWWVDGPISNERYNRLNWNGYAATHHVGEVSPVGTALRALDPEKQRIVQGILRFEKGLPVGNDPANFVTAFVYIYFGLLE